MPSHFIESRASDDLRRAKLLVLAAVDADEANRTQDALALYMQAAECCLKQVRSAMNNLNF